MNIRCDRGDNAFYAEYQNDPLPSISDQMEVLTAAAIDKKKNGYKRGVVPAKTTHITAFIDVQQTILYWMVCAWEDNFSGAIIDYGTHPEQGRSYFTMRDAKRTIQIEHKESGFEANLYAALDKCVSMLAGREYRHDDGTAMRLERLMIDANWGASTDIVYQFCRATPFANIVVPSHGRYIGASSLPMSEYAKRAGDRVGPNWRMPGTAGKRAVRHCLYDTNFWKSFMVARLQTAVGEPGCLSLFGHHDHGLLSDHLLAEAPVRTEARGRVVDEWKTKMVGQDNHWLDCLVGNCVAASMSGVAIVGVEGQGGARKRYGASDSFKTAGKPRSFVA
jgi:phage terminase large subunit GpA-like protein